MDPLSRLLSHEVLNYQVVNGISLYFVLIFFVPLALVATLFWLYCALARRSVLGVAKVLSGLWLLACVPAALMMLMGVAFNPAKAASLLLLPFWVGGGLALLWLPVWLRRLLRIRPV